MFQQIIIIDYVYLSNDIGLYVSVVVFTGPHEAAGTFESLGHHVVD